MPETLSAYDEIAGLYHALWADWYLPAALPALEKLFFSCVRRSARVLDLCCGSGHVTKELVRRGYNVTGIDSSAALIALGQKDMPDVDLRVQDARDFKLESRCDGAVSTFDSMNHLLSLEELRRVFDRVRGALHTDGLFVFDMNLEQAYCADLRQWTVDIRDNSVGLMRGGYDRAAKQATTELIWFVRNAEAHLWRQHRSIVKERCYAQAEILQGLLEAGFHGLEAIPAENAGVSSDLGFGRVFFVARA